MKGTWSSPDRYTSNPQRVPNATLQLAWVDFLSRVPWDIFVTLTFDQKRVFPVTCARAGNDAFRWCGYVAWALRRPIAWLIAPERAASGQWHAHALLVGVPQNISILSKAWELGRGRIDVRRIHNSAGVVLYSTKEAAFSGDILLSDTLARYSDRLNREPLIALYASDQISTSVSEDEK